MTKKRLKPAEYSEKHNLPQVYRELVAKILLRRPSSKRQLRELIVSDLHKFDKKRKSLVLATKDFENFYDELNFFNNESLTEMDCKYSLERLGVQKPGNVHSFGKKDFSMGLRQAYNSMFKRNGH